MLYSFGNYLTSSVMNIDNQKKKKNDKNIGIIDKHGYDLILI